MTQSLISSCVEVDLRDETPGNTPSFNARRALYGIQSHDVVKLIVGTGTPFLLPDVLDMLDGLRIQITAPDGHALRKWETYLSTEAA